VKQPSGPYGLLKKQACACVSSAGADTSITDAFGKTPLEQARVQDHAVLVQLLETL
jgi:hypothetical protein